MMPAFVLDTSWLLHGMELPGPAVLAAAADREVRPGGKDHRRLEQWKLAGLQVRAPGDASREVVRQHAQRTGDAVALSPADLDGLALAFELKVPLLTHDRRIMNVARIAKIEIVTPDSHAIDATWTWTPTCRGCRAKWTQGCEPPSECPICGHPYQLKRQRDR